MPMSGQDVIGKFEKETKELFSFWQVVSALYFA
jgi:hypothetical protein